MESWLKITTTQEEVYGDYSTTHVEESLSETLKASAKSYTEDMPQKRRATRMVSSKIWNYHNCEIIYNI